MGVSRLKYSVQPRCLFLRKASLSIEMGGEATISGLGIEEDQSRDGILAPIMVASVKVRVSTQDLASPTLS